MKKTAFTLTLAFLCILTVFALDVQTAQAITINEDGSIVGTDRLSRDGNVYTLTGDIIYTIRVTKSNVVLDGAGFTLEGSEIEGNGAGIILLPEAKGVTIKNMNIKGFGNAITLTGSGHTVTGCSVTDCSTGIWLNDAAANVITNNIFIDTPSGIRLGDSSNNQLNNNKFTNSSLSIGLEANSNHIDPSNTIDGKPIYYFANQKNLVISPDYYPVIGYLALVNCEGITVRDLKLVGTPANGIGLILRNTINSTIIHNYITNFWHGISSTDSYNNLITENYIAGNQEFGIAISATTTNTITKNTFANNKIGIYLAGSNQVIFHNNFINNTVHVDSSDWSPINFLPLNYGVHVWDNGYPSGGNYWSGHNTTDTNGDGICDIPYNISSIRNNTDRYPLTKPVEIPEFAEATEPPNINHQALPIEPILLFAIAIVAAGVGILVYMKHKGKK